jgi:spore germination protein KC
MDDLPGVAFSNIYNNADLSAEFINTDLLSLCKDYYSEYSQSMISEISFEKSKLLPGDEISNDLMEQVEFGGAAIFDKDKMLGWLTPEETKGLSFVFSKTRDTLVTVKEPSQPNKFVSIELERVKTKIITNIITKSSAAEKGKIPVIMLSPCLTGLSKPVE